MKRHSGILVYLAEHVYHTAIAEKGGDSILTDNATNYCEINEDLVGILKDITEVEKIYNRYRGLTVTFPKKLYNRKFVRQYIAENHGKESVQEIARNLDLSERRVKQLLKELKENGV